MKTLMITESHIPDDVRVWQEALLLKNNGIEVSIICLKNNTQKFLETINGIKIYRIPKIELLKQEKQKISNTNSKLNYTKAIISGLAGYGFEYFYFTFISFLFSIYILLKENFDVLHTHNPPDTLFLIGMFYKIFGKKYIFDHHDLAPDLFEEKYKSKGGMIYRLLRFLETSSCKTANLIIATNNSYKELEVKRANIAPSKVYIVRNGPDLVRIRKNVPIQSITNMNKVILCYLGSINNQDGVDNLVDIMSKIVYEHKNQSFRLLILGDGDYLHRIKEIANELNVLNYIIFAGYVQDSNELCKYLSSADIFVDAAFNTFYNSNSTFIKHMEYMVFAKPIVSFDLKETKVSLKDGGVYIPNNNTNLFAEKLIEISQNPKFNNELKKIYKKRIKELSWENVSKPLIAAYSNLNNTL
jgi:glycosyltransferase involved in cell wall biosynthesis